MDWSRAKNIIIVLLILLNIFLFVNVMNVKNSFNITGQYQNNAKQALEAAGIVVECIIPNHNKPMSRISYVKNDSDFYRKIVNTLIGADYSDKQSSRWEKDGRSLQFLEDAFIFMDNTATINFSADDEKKLNKQLLSWIKNNGLSNEAFILKSFYKEDTTVTVEYVQEYNNIPLFSNWITFTITENKLYKVEGSMNILDIIKPSKQKDEIVSPNIILLTGKDKVRGDISSVVLGYLRPKNEELYDVPVWRINYKSGGETYFNAFTGEWISG